MAVHEPPWSTIAELVDDAARRFPDVEAVVEGPERWTFPSWSRGCEKPFARSSPPVSSAATASASGRPTSVSGSSPGSPCTAPAPRYKVPRAVEFVDALPVNATGKVLKYELRAQATARTT